VEGKEMNQISWKEKFRAVREGASLDEYRGRKDNILVIAPHPDDDVLGAGGTMVEASTHGRGVFSVYITDGRGSPRKGPSISDDEMVRRREKEALAALRAVGAVGGFFLRKRSSELEGEGGRETQGELEEIIRWIAPGEVYLPAPYERHPTHQSCTRLAIEGLRRIAAGEKPVLLGYSLWGCFWGEKGRVVRDISPHVRKKVEAVLAHSTQIAYKNYQQGILGKNNYEAIFWESDKPQKMGFAEIFLDLSVFLENKDLTLESFIRQDVEAFIQTFL
jgi:LmbE family N-acetylglucosaminyl deacetylase